MAEWTNEETSSLTNEIKDLIQSDGIDGNSIEVRNNIFSFYVGDDNEYGDQNVEIDDEHGGTVEILYDEYNYYGDSPDFEQIASDIAQSIIDYLERIEEYKKEEY